ncbi:hypothetical protein SAMN02927924_02075 [Sphingobium faniae]|nr:hypothetical protein SAMN02927924_02075 [Sphingobium faniae]
MIVGVTGEKLPASGALPKSRLGALMMQSFSTVSSTLIRTAVPLPQSNTGPPRSVYNSPAARKLKRSFRASIT